MDTIYALSSGALPSGVAVVRVSGPQTAKILETLGGALPEPRRAEMRSFGRPGEPIDRGLALWFPGPRSFTGEDVAELHVHGGRAVIAAFAQALSDLGARLALPGEFARRAFVNGKLDLTEVEGLADLIAAETEAQRRQAVAAAGGALAERAEEWRNRLIGLRAEIEARLDFSEEDDVGEALPPEFWQRAGDLKREMEEALRRAGAGERLREGFRVAILGRPNAGKSSLLNAIARRDVAIVTAEAGTTRDVLVAPLDIRGYPLLLFDTAGIREAASEAEREGVRRAGVAAASADLVLWLEDGTNDSEPAPIEVSVPVWRIRTKIDLGTDRSAPAADLAISSRSGQGMAELITMLGQAAAASIGVEPALITRQRQREAIAQAVNDLERLSGSAEEVAADLLRSASEAIGRLSGRVDVEDVLDRLFAEFCIGK